MTINLSCWEWVSPGSSTGSFIRYSYLRSWDSAEIGRQLIVNLLKGSGVPVHEIRMD